MRISQTLKYWNIWIFWKQKAARLKVLTEDVVEASKSKAPENLTLNMTNLDFVEMLHQVIGEFEERFEEHHLTMMVHFPDEPSVICADGQRMWRVLENIFGQRNQVRNGKDQSLRRSAKRQKPGDLFPEKLFPPSLLTSQQRN